MIRNYIRRLVREEVAAAVPNRGPLVMPATEGVSTDMIAHTMNLDFNNPPRVIFFTGGRKPNLWERLHGAR